MTKNYAEVHPQVNVKLPLPSTPEKAVKSAIVRFFKEKLLLEWNAFAPPFYHQSGWWVRCSAQVWNDVSLLYIDDGTGNWKRPTPR